MNHFEALSILADREQWCWNLNCTTCGHGVFRWGLKALVRGMNPDAEEWPVHWGPKQTFGLLAQTNGSLPRLAWWPEVDQRALQDAAVGCNVNRLAKIVRFPDWLGHIGIILRYTEDAERHNHLLTEAFVPQLVELVVPGSDADLILRRTLESGTPFLWSDLELVERWYRGLVTGTI